MTAKQKETNQDTPQQICICPNCGYSRRCLDSAICMAEICPLCETTMTLEPRRGS